MRLWNNFSEFIDFFLYPALITGCFFTLNITGVAYASTFEYVAVMLALVGTMMLKRENAWGQIVMFGGQLFFLFYFLQIGLMGQFMFSTIWGMLNLISFWMWMHSKKKNKRIKIPSFMNPTWWLFLLAGLLAATVYKWNAGFIGTLDWAVLYLGLIGQIILARKKADGWLVWSFFSIGSIILFWATASYLLLFRSAIYLPTYIGAFIKWRRVIIKRKKIKIANNAGTKRRH